MRDRLSIRCRRWSVLALAVGLTAAICGCPKGGRPGRSGGDGDTWVVFDVSEKGSGNPLLAYVWIEEYSDDFETLMGGETARFEGLGKTGDGYVVPFVSSQEVTFVVWSPGHEMEAFDTRLKKGENLLSVQLRKTAIEDEEVPEVIRMDVLERLPSEGLRTGS